MKKFKNTFGVVGTKALIKAFAVEAELLGWKFDSVNRTKEDIGVSPKNLWFCASDNKTLSLKPGHYWCDEATNAQYTLPQDWELALKAASEVVEDKPKVVVPEYAKCNKTGGYYDVTEGKIYKVIKFEENYNGLNRITITNDNGKDEGIGNVFPGNGAQHTDFVLSTKEAYDAQNMPKIIVGEYYVNKHKNDPWTIFIAKSLNGKNIITKEYLNTEVRAFFKSFNTTLDKNTRLATTEERQWLDACVKAGKYLTKEEALKPVYKVGDWVYSLVEVLPYRKVGDVFKVFEVSSRVIYYLPSTNGDISTFRLATPKEIAEVTESPLSTTLILGTSNIKVTVYKDGKVEAEGHVGTVDEVKLLTKRMKPTGCVSGWEISFPSIKIGCSTFTLDELKQIVTAHDKLNQSEW